MIVRMWLPSRVFVLLLLLIGSIHVQIVTAGGDVLDSYGNAVALQHAATAADVQGRSRVVVSLPSSMIYILSPAVELPANRRFNHTSTSAARIAPSSYLLATGVAPDILWLRQQLRLYYKHVQERYIPDAMSTKSANPTSFAMVTSLLLRQFWQESDSETNTWLPVGYQILMQEAGDDRPSWGRPLGVRCLLIQWNGRRFGLDEFDPSGRIVRTSKEDEYNEIQIFCLGPKRTEIQDALMKRRIEMKEAALSCKDEELEALLAQALAPFGPSWQLERMTPIADGTIAVEQRILSASE